MSTGVVLLHLGLAAVMSLIALNGYLRRAAKAKTDAALSVAWVGLRLAAAYFFGWKQGLLATVLFFLYTTIATPFAKRLAHRGWLVSFVGDNLTVAGFAGVGMAGAGGEATVGCNCN